LDTPPNWSGTPHLGFFIQLQEREREGERERGREREKGEESRKHWSLGGSGVLLRGHLDTWSTGIEPATFRWAGQPLLPPELLPP